MVVSKKSDHIKVKITMSNTSQEPPESSKAPNEDLKDMDVLCTFKIKIESKNLIMGTSRTNDHFQIKIKMPKSNEESPLCYKSPYQDSKYMDVLCNSKIMIESHNSEYGCIKDP